MSTVRLYRFRRYDIQSDNFIVSRRWATREAIEGIGHEILEDTAVDVDASAIGSEIPGMTRIDFDPHATAGFQTVVRPMRAGRI